MRHVTRNVLQICMLKMIRELARFPSAWPRLAHRARIGILRLASEAARAMRAASSLPTQAGEVRTSKVRRRLRCPGPVVSGGQVAQW